LEDTADVDASDVDEFVKVIVGSSRNSREARKSEERLLRRREEQREVVEEKGRAKRGC
jgi:hypothetical protein